MIENLKTDITKVIQKQFSLKRFSIFKKSISDLDQKEKYRFIIDKQLDQIEKLFDYIMEEVTQVFNIDIEIFINSENDFDYIKEEILEISQSQE